MSSRGWVIGGVVAGLVAGGAGGGYAWWNGQRQQDRDAQAVVQALATAWSAKKLDGASPRFVDPAGPASFATVTKGMGAAPVTAKAGAVTRQGDRATATLSVTWTLPGGVPWAYQMPVTATDTTTGWAIAKPASGSYWHPQLQAGQTLAVKRVAGTRGDLLDRSGQPLMPLGAVYPVQLDPSRATAAAAAALEKVVDEPAGTLVAKLAAAQKAGSKSPIPVITYREADFAARRSALDALTGVVYPKTLQPLARSRTFGQPMLGSFGEVTAEVIEKGKGRYAAGDRAGLSGLQGQYDEVLGGTPGVTVATNTGKTLFEQAAVDGADVTLTLDPTVQAAAEKALTATGSVPSGLVAVDVRTGDIIASANSPAGGFDRALTGQFPPGSALKVATTYSLLSSGKVTPQSSVTCPKTVVVDGRSFKNFEGETLGTPTFAADFHHSCNTAFVQLAEKMGDGDLAAAATALGVGAGWGPALGVANAFAGSVPVANGLTDKVAAAIGQGRNLASPAALAVMAASVARGNLIQPALVTSPAPSGVDRTPKPLDPAVIASLRSLMRGVVTEGTAPVLASTPGGPVSGKTGTAEFGTKNPPETHAWMVGFQGDVAFAVIVEQGRSGGAVAAPIAKDFLTALAAG